MHSVRLKNQHVSQSSVKKWRDIYELMLKLQRFRGVAVITFR